MLHQIAVPSEEGLSTQTFGGIFARRPYARSLSRPMLVAPSVMTNNESIYIPELWINQVNILIYIFLK